jgi:hypothetical protein
MILIIIGIALALLGYFLAMPILWILGIVAIVVGLIIVLISHFGGV